MAEYLDPNQAGLPCAHCHRRRDEHHLVNWSAEGLGAGEAQLVCPTSVFFHRIERSRASAAAARAEDSR